MTTTMARGGAIRWILMNRWTCLHVSIFAMSAKWISKPQFQACLQATLTALACGKQLEQDQASLSPKARKPMDGYRAQGSAFYDPTKAESSLIASHLAAIRRTPAIASTVNAPSQSATVAGDQDKPPADTKAASSATEHNPTEQIELNVFTVVKPKVGSPQLRPHYDHHFRALKADFITGFHYQAITQEIWHHT
jgi:hypothetical protein